MSRYEEAKKMYAAYGVNAEAAIERHLTSSISTAATP